MKMHKNARLTLLGRERIVRQVESGQTLETIATGRDAISGAVDNLFLSLPPDFVFTATGRAVGHNGAARPFGRAGPPDGRVAITGRD